MVLLPLSVTHEPFITVVRTGPKLDRMAAPRVDESAAKLVVAHKDATLRVIQSKENGALATPVSSSGDILNLQFLRIALRRIAMWGLSGSLVVHLILGALSAVVIGQRAILVIVKPVEEEPDVTLTLPEPPKAKQEDKRSAEPAYVRSTEPQQQPQQPQETPPAKRDFISDKSSVAMSVDAPEPGGDPTLPTVKGTEALARDLVQSVYREGTSASGNYPALPSLSPPPEPVMAQPLSAPPQPVMAQDAASKVEQMQKADTPVDSLSQTKHEMPELASVSVTNSVAQSPPATATPQAQIASSDASEARMSKGGVTRRGDQNAVNAARTMAGEYYREAQDAITRRWNKEMEIANIHMLPGTVVLRVLVDKNGGVRYSDISVISGRAGQVLAQTATMAVLHTKLPPLPEGMDPVLEGDKFEFQMNFILH